MIGEGGIAIVERATRMRNAFNARSLVAPQRPMERGAQHRKRIERWFGWGSDTRPLRSSKVDTLFAGDHGLRASYDTLLRYVHQQLA